MPAEYVGKDVAVVALDSMLAAYYEGKQIALHRISYQRKDMVVNPQHYRRLTLKQTMDAEDVLFSDFMLQWLEIVKPTTAITTYSSYSNMVKGIIVPYFKARGIMLKQLRPTDIQAFYME